MLRLPKISGSSIIIKFIEDPSKSTHNIPQIFKERPRRHNKEQQGNDLKTKVRLNIVVTRQPTYN